MDWAKNKIKMEWEFANLLILREGDPMLLLSLSLLFLYHSLELEWLKGKRDKTETGLGFEHEQNGNYSEDLIDNLLVAILNSFVSRLL